jgi:hypothetical protein
MNFPNLLCSYKMASELEEFHTYKFSSEEYTTVANAFLASGDIKSQAKTLSCFKKLDKNELLRRCNVIGRLHSILCSMHNL